MSERVEQVEQETEAHEQANERMAIAQRTARFEGKLKGKFEETVPHHYPELSADEALESLRRGHTIARVFINELVISEELSKQLTFREVYIKQLTIKHATFAQNVSFLGCHLYRTQVEGSTFEAGLSLKRTQAHLFHLFSCEIKGGLNAESFKGRSKIIFAKSVIHKRARFWEAQLDDWASFEEVTFKDRFDFRSVECKAGLTLHRCHFESDALFRGAHIALKLEANESRFEGLIDLSKAKLHDFVYLEDIEQGEGQRWAFWNTVSERILVRPEQVEGRLESEEQEDFTKAMREYGVLKRSYEHEHLYSYDDWAFYRFKVNERRARGATWSEPWTKLWELFDYLLLDWGCGYGTNPLRAVRAALVMVFVFAVVYTLGYDKLHPVDQVPFSDLPKDALLNRFGVSLFLSVAAFTSGFGDLRDVAMDWMNIPLMTEALLGTLLWGLFIVAFGRKVVR